MSDEGRGKRTLAEWVTFAVASAIVLGLAVLIGVEAASAKDPPAPTTRVVGEPRRTGDSFEVEVEVTNEGDETAESVQVVGALEVGEDTFDAEQVVDFLSGGETVVVHLLFPEDPDEGELDVHIAGFSEP